MGFPEKLSSLLASNGHTIAWLSRQTGIIHSAISAMTRGERRPYMDQALSIARALGVSLDFLANDEVEEESERVTLSNSDQLVLSFYRQTMITPGEALKRLAGNRIFSVNGTVINKNKFTYVHKISDGQIRHVVHLGKAESPILLDESEAPWVLPQIGLFIALDFNKEAEDKIGTHYYHWKNYVDLDLGFIGSNYDSGVNKLAISLALASGRLVSFKDGSFSTIDGKTRDKFDHFLKITGD